MNDTQGSRISKLMAERGLCSRREADAYIERGLVFVNGERVTQLGTRALPDAVITLAAEARASQAQQVTILLHKPVGYVSGQAEDGHLPAVTLINAKTEMGWTFVYLGANQDAWQVGRSIGVPVSGSMTYDANSLEIPTMLRKMSQATTRHMDEKMHMRRENPSAAPQSREFFTEEDATDLGKKRPPSDN